MAIFKLTAFSCVVPAPLVDSKGAAVEETSDFAQAVAQGFVEIYVIGTDGTYKFHKLREGAGGKSRFIQSKVQSLPNGVKPMSLCEKIDFLPDGKIPFELLSQVRSFFRQVIEKKGVALEAMIWILWSQDKGYYLFVPDQKVGHASAVYDWSGVPAGSSVVVDIHSHANFNAFFSGTDDNDDRNSIRYSMVIGHNDKPGFDYKLRFNYLGQKTTVDLNEIFQEVVHDTTIPETWVEKVTVASAPSHGRHGNVREYPLSNPMAQSFRGRGFEGFDGGFGFIPQETSSRRNGVWTATSSVSANAKSGAEEVGKESLGKGRVGVSHTSTQAKGASTVQEVKGRVIVDEDSPGNNLELGGFDNVFSHGEEYPFIDFAGEGSVSKKALTSPTTEVPSEERCNKVLDHDPFKVRNEDTVEMEEGLFDAIAINHGPDAAVSYVQILKNLPGIQGDPELIGNVVDDLFTTLDDSGQLSVFKSLWGALSSSNQEKIQTNGL